MRNAFERRQVQVLQSRSLAHRVMQMLWRTTQPSAKDLRFYGVFTSWCILLVMVAFVVFTLFYLIMYTAYLKDEIVYHWLAWTLTLFGVLSLPTSHSAGASAPMHWPAPQGTKKSL